MQILIRKITMFFIAFVAIAVIMGVSVVPVGAQESSEAKKAVCQGLGGAVGGTDECEDPSGSASLDSTIKNVINILSLVVGVIAVIMVIVGGLKYVASQGDSGGVTSAKNTVIYAIVGLVIVALAQVIVRFMAGRVTDSTSTTPITAPVEPNPDPECRPGEPC